MTQPLLREMERAQREGGQLTIDLEILNFFAFFTKYASLLQIEGHLPTIIATTTAGLFHIWSLTVIIVSKAKNINV